MDIQEAWNERRRLRAEGAKLNDLADSKEKIEADILYISSNSLFQQGDIVFYNAVLEKYGNVEIEWDDMDAIVEGVRYYRWEERPEVQGGLKVFVWEGVLTDYTSGIVMALAHNKEEALRLIKAECHECMGEIEGIEPRIMNAPEAIVLWGGG